MTPQALLDELKQLNVKVSLNGDRLRLEAPAGVLTPDLREKIRQHKTELAALLRKLKEEQAKQLLEEQGWVAIYSETLGETVIWCRDEKVAIPTKWKDAVRYTLAELREISRLDKEGLKRIHEAKKRFKGEVVSLREQPRARSP